MAKKEYSVNTEELAGYIAELKELYNDERLNKLDMPVNKSQIGAMSESIIKASKALIETKKCIKELIHYSYMYFADKENTVRKNDMASAKNISH